MIVYAVELQLDLALREEYLGWLREHVAEMLTLPGFLDAEILEPRDPPPPPGQCILCALYRLPDIATLQRYVVHDAPRMREAGLRRFGDRVRATRRVLETL